VNGNIVLDMNSLSISSRKEIRGVNEIQAYTKEVESMQQIAVIRLKEKATQQGANAVVGLRYSSTLTTGSSSFLNITAYGTAVIIE